MSKTKIQKKIRKNLGNFQEQIQKFQEQIQKKFSPPQVIIKKLRQKTPFTDYNEMQGAGRSDTCRAPLPNFFSRTNITFIPPTHTQKIFMYHHNL